MHTAAPWYRQFWPWFLLALPAVVVVAGFITLYIAIHHADSPVRDHYAKEGLILRRDQAQDQAAARLGLGARLAIGAGHRAACWNPVIYDPRTSIKACLGGGFQSYCVESNSSWLAVTPIVVR